MLLLVVDDNSAFEKKERYINELHVDNIIHALSLDEAQKILSRRLDTLNIALIINQVLIEDIKFEEDELRKITRTFHGSIILKVDDDLVGIHLMKKGLITDYYLSNSDEKLELSRLKQAFKLSMLKQRMRTNIYNANKNLKLIHEMRV